MCVCTCTYEGVLNIFYVTPPRAILEEGASVDWPVEGIVSINNCCEGASLTVGGATPRLVVLSTVRKQPEKATRAS